MNENVGLEHSSKSTKYELEGSYGDPVHEHFSFLKTAKLPRECNDVVFYQMRQSLTLAIDPLSMIMSNYAKLYHANRTFN